MRFWRELEVCLKYPLICTACRGTVPDKHDDTLFSPCLGEGTNEAVMHRIAEIWRVDAYADFGICHRCLGSYRNSPVEQWLDHWIKDEQQYEHERQEALDIVNRMEGHHE